MTERNRRDDRSALGESFGVEDVLRESPALRMALGLAGGGVVVWWLVSHGHIRMSWVVIAGVLVSAMAALVYHRKIFWVLSRVRYHVRRIRRRRHVLLRDLDVTREDIRHHVLFLGPTGSGKTTAMERLFLSSVLKKGSGGVYLDPKDGLAITHILERIPSSEQDRVILIEPARDDYLIGLNPLDCPNPKDREIVAEQVVGTFHRLYSQYWKHGTDRVMQAAVLTLLEHEGTTLLDVPVLLTNPGRRAEWTRDLENPVLRDYWDDYERWTPANREASIGPLLSKLQHVLLRGAAYRMLGQEQTTIDIDRAINHDSAIVLCDLSKGKLGEDTSPLIGSLLVARIWQAVMRRAAIPDGHRIDFVLCVDEFQNFTHSFGTLTEALAESRSLNVGWVLGHQYRGQITDSMWAGVAANTLTKVVFRGPDQGLVRITRRRKRCCKCGRPARGRIPCRCEVPEWDSDQPLKQYHAALQRRLGPSTTVKTKKPSKPRSDAQELALHSLQRWGRPRATVDFELANRNGRPEVIDVEPTGEGLGKDFDLV